MMPERPVAIALAAYLAYVVAARSAELALSARNGRRLVARGARLRQDDGFRLIVLLHVLYPLALAAEVALLGARPGVAWPGWLALWLGAQGLRLACMQVLGERWHVRVLAPPDAAPVTRGPYRFLRHPNYLAVATEIPAAALMFGAWRTAFVFSLVNAFALWRRIRVENRAVYGRSGAAG